MFERPHDASLRSYKGMLDRAEANVRRLDSMLIDTDGRAETLRSVASERARADRLIYVVSRLITAWHNDVAERANNRLRSRR